MQENKGPAAKAIWEINSFIIAQPRRNILDVSFSKIVCIITPIGIHDEGIA